MFGSLARLKKVARMMDIVCKVGLGEDWSGCSSRCSYGELNPETDRGRDGQGSGRGIKRFLTVTEEMYKNRNKPKLEIQIED